MPPDPEREPPPDGESGGQLRNTVGRTKFVQQSTDPHGPQHAAGIRLGITRYWARYEADPIITELAEMRELLDAVVVVVEQLVEHANSGVS